MEAVVFDDSPLAEYLEGVSWLHAFTHANDSGSLTSSQVRAATIPMAFPVSSLSLRQPRRAHHLPREADQPFDRNIATDYLPLYG